MKKYGVELQPSDGDHYAMFVKALDAELRVADRDEELFIVDDEAELALLTELMEEYELEYEEFELLALPEAARTTPLFGDYGFVSDSGKLYLYGHLCAVFSFAPSGADAEPAQALEQMEEHLLAGLLVDGEAHYAVDKGLGELMRGIAKAYRCRLEFWYGG